MLEVHSISSGYGETQVLYDVSFAIDKGEVVTLLGRNGMGKTTTIYALLGAVRLWSGEIEFRGHALRGLRSYRIARLGIGLVPEGRQVFPTLSVRENLVATAANRSGSGDPWTLDKVIDLFPQLGSRIGSPANLLSGGEQQMLAIGRALMTNPHLIILDEATEGLAPLARREIWSCLQRLKDMGQATLLIDKNLAPLCKLADRHVILHRGRTVWQGTSEQLMDPASDSKRYLEL